MVNDYLTIALSFVMGLAVFASMPLIFNKKMIKHMLFLNAFAIGILVFLLLDIYGDVAGVFGNSSITNPLEIIFIVGFALSFLFFIMPKESRDPELSPKRTSMLAAIGIGFQNLTEGLLFGSAGAAGLVPIYVLSIIGFTLQNMTEGFPIAAPMVGAKQAIEKKFIVGAFIIGGAPTVVGTVIGIFFFSNAFITLFDALASAAILYVVFVLFHVNINRGRALMDGKGVHNFMWTTYAGILLGFVIAYVVNYTLVIP